MMVRTRDIDYTADGSTMIGRLALPEGQSRRPAVLIAHDGGGLDDYQKSRAELFANLGYVTFALDYYGGGGPLTDRDEMAARCQALWSEPERIRDWLAPAWRCWWKNPGRTLHGWRPSATASAAPWCSNSPGAVPM